MLSRHEKLKRASVLLARRLFGSVSSKASSTTTSTSGIAARDSAMKLATSTTTASSSTSSATNTIKALPAVLPSSSRRISQALQPKHQHVR